MERLLMQVFGRVQGVGYRVATRRKATALGLVGWVRNEPDGSVRLVAEGPRTVLEQLARWALAGGPPGGMVNRHERSFAEATGEFSAFVVHR